MRPPRCEDQVGIIDTVAECNVIRDALADPEVIMAQPFDMTHDGYEESTIMRMREETDRGIPVVVQALGFGLIVHTAQHEQRDIPIYEEDVPFVLRAAERVLEDKSLPGIIHNVVTGRRKASWGMVNFFAEAGYPEAIVCRGLYGRSAVGHHKKMLNY
jgi:hypothetical protein